MDYGEGKTQPVVSQTEALDESGLGVTRFFTPMHGGSSIDGPQRTVSDQPTQMGQGSSQAKTQIRAYFLVDVGIWPDEYKYSHILF